MVPTSKVPISAPLPIESSASALTFLKFLEQRGIKVFLFTDRGNTKISMPEIPASEAQSLLEQWRLSQK